MDEPSRRSARYRRLRRYKLSSRDMLWLSLRLVLGLGSSLCLSGGTNKGSWICLFPLGRVFSDESQLPRFEKLQKGFVVSDGVVAGVPQRNLGWPPNNPNPIPF